jgi:hypothetical protein
LFSNIKTIIHAKKDATVSFTIEKIINIKTKDLGVKVTDFSIDSQNKNMTGTLHQKDEKPLTITAINYCITTKNGKHFLEVEKIEKSHAWENSYIDGKRYKIPPEVLKIVEFVL